MGRTIDLHLPAPASARRAGVVQRESQHDYRDNAVRGIGAGAVLTAAQARLDNVRPFVIILGAGQAQVSLNTLAPLRLWLRQHLLAAGALPGQLNGLLTQNYNVDVGVHEIRI